MSTEPQYLLHITHARQDEAWVRGVLIPALGLAEGQYWTRAEDDLGALKVEELERAVRSCRYTLLVASSAARVDQWAQFAGLLAERLGIEESKPRLLLVARDFVPGSERARELLPLCQRCLVCLDCSDPERTTAALKTLAAQLAVTTTEAPPTECPYPGLRMFGAGDPASCFQRTDLFFGREDEARAIVEQLRGSGRVLLVGPSGCGKSSLVRARVLPTLSQGADAMAVTVARPGAHPDVALRAALDALDPRLGPAIDAYLGATDKQVALTTLVAAAAGSRRLVYLDQLEEVFLDEADEHGERGRFFARLAALGRVPGVAILLGMRADFYDDLMRSPAWGDFKDHRVELAPLRGAALRLAITRPAEVVGVYVEPDLVERLVREADLDRAAEALPLLQVALEQLWAQREWRYLSLASYERIADGERRGLDVVLARHADASIAALAGPAQALARRVLIDLVHLGEGRPDTRRRRTSSELCRAGDDSGALGQVLDHLSARRLIAISAEASEIAAVQTVALQAADGDHTRHVDLAHDTLITGWPALAGWIRARRDDLRTQRRLEARAAGGGLLAASELPEFTRWVAWIATPAGQALGASEALRALVRRSVVARRFRRTVFGMGLVVTTLFAILFGLQTMHLRKEKTKTQLSISEGVKAAEAVVFEIDELRTLAGASSIRETLLERSRELLAELRKLGDLGDRGLRTIWAGKVAQADVALEHSRLEFAHALYLEARTDAQLQAITHPTNHRWQRSLAVSSEKLGDVTVRAGNLDEARRWFEDEARRWFEQALAARKPFADAHPTNVDGQRDLSVSYTELGGVTMTAGKLDDARTWFDKALEVGKSLADADPANADWQRGLRVSYTKLGDVYTKLGDVAATAGKLDDARTWFDKALAARKALTEADSTNADWQHSLSVSYEKLGDIAMATCELDDARRWFDKALEVGKSLADADPANADWQRGLRVSYTKLGDVYTKLGDVAVTAGKLDDARTWFDKALAAHEALTEANSNNADWQHSLSVSYERLGDIAVATGELDDARRWFDKALEVGKALTDADPANADWQRGLAVTYTKSGNVYTTLGDVAMTSGKLDDARAWFDKALAVRQPLANADPTNAAWQRDLAVSYTKSGEIAVTARKLNIARAWFKKSLGIRTAFATADPANTEWQRDLSVSYMRLGDVTVMVGKLGEARAWFDKALATRKTLIAHDPANAGRQLDLGIALTAIARVARDPDEAKRCLSEARIIHGRLQRGGHFQSDVDFARFGMALDKFTARSMNPPTKPADTATTRPAEVAASNPGVAEAGVGDDLKDALAEADQDLAGGDYSAAKKAARRAIRKGGDIRAYANLAIAYCGLGDLGNAKAQLLHLIGPTLAHVNKKCKSLGVDLE